MLDQAVAEARGLDSSQNAGYSGYNAIDLIPTTSSAEYQAAASSPTTPDIPVDPGAQGVPMAEQTSAETDAKIALAKAQTSIEIVRMEGKLDLLISNLSETRATLSDLSRQIEGAKKESRDDNVTTRNAARNNAWVVGIGLAVLIVAIVTLVVGMAAIYPSVFGIGTQMKDAIDASVEKQMKLKP